MNRRVLAAVAAVILAVVGGVLLTTYVQNADARALAGTQPADVLVVTAAIDRGTTLEEARASLAVKKLPGVAVVEGAVASVNELASGSVASADLMVGEQVLTSRFVDPSSDEVNDLVTVPKGLQELSIQLEPQRVIGSRLRAGDTVGIIGSFEIKDARAPDSEAIETTQLVLNTVLVTRVQGVVASNPDGGDATAEAPSDSVMVTMAVSARDAEKIVFAAEWGKIWLTQQRENTDNSTSRLTTAGNIYR